MQNNDRCMQNLGWGAATLLEVGLSVKLAYSCLAITLGMVLFHGACAALVHAACIDLEQDSRARLAGGALRLHAAQSSSCCPVNLQSQW